MKTAKVVESFTLFDTVVDLLRKQRIRQVRNVHVQNIKTWMIIAIGPNHCGIKMDLAKSFAVSGGFELTPGKQKTLSSCLRHRLQYKITLISKVTPKIFAFCQIY